MLCLSAFCYGSFAQIKKTPAPQSSTRAKVVTSTNHGSTVKAYPVKADGSADMRYKVNQKRNVKVLKKDGTRDMRYKVNSGKKN